MVAGVFVLAAPVAGLAAAGVGVASHLKNKQLRQEKERLYKEALKKHDAMCHMQINRFRQYSEQLKALLSSDKKNENNGEDHSDDSK